MKHQPKIFDVAVIGTGLAGLITATRLRKENRNVLLLKEEKYHSVYHRDGYRFVPFSNFSEKLIKTSLFRKIPYQADRKADRKDGERPKREVSFQVILPEARIDLYRERPLLQREWKREFHGEWDLIEKFYAELDRARQALKDLKDKEPPGSLFPVRTGSFLKRWFSFDGLPGGRTDRWLAASSAGLKTFIDLQMISRGNLLTDSFPVSLASYLLLGDEEDGWRKRDGLEHVTQTLLEGLIQSGSIVEEIEGVERAEMKRGEGVTLSLKGREEAFQARCLVLNAPLHRFSDLFGTKGKGVSRWSTKIRPEDVMIPFFIGIREKAIPVGMRDLLVSVMDVEKPYEEGNLLLFSLSHKGDETQAPEGKRALTVQGVLPFGKTGKNTLAALEEGVMKHLQHLFPFLQNHTEFIDRKWAEDQVDCWSYPHYFYKTDSVFHWRRGAVPTRISGCLYFTGKENFPQMGLEGEILSGLKVGGEISKRLR
jgi:phytoene dehydrogenase-like protein